VTLCLSHKKKFLYSSKYIFLVCIGNYSLESYKTNWKSNYSYNALTFLWLNFNKKPLITRREHVNFLLLTFSHFFFTLKTISLMKVIINQMLKQKYKVEFLQSTCNYVWIKIFLHFHKRDFRIPTSPKDSCWHKIHVFINLVWFN